MPSPASEFLPNMSRSDSSDQSPCGAQTDITNIHATSAISSALGCAALGSRQQLAHTYTGVKVWLHGSLLSVYPSGSWHAWSMPHATARPTWKLQHCNDLTSLEACWAPGRIYGFHGTGLHLHCEIQRGFGVVSKGTLAKQVFCSQLHIRHWVTASTERAWHVERSRHLRPTVTPSQNKYSRNLTCASSSCIMLHIMKTDMLLGS